MLRGGVGSGVQLLQRSVCVQLGDAGSVCVSVGGGGEGGSEGVVA